MNHRKKKRIGLSLAVPALAVLGWLVFTASTASAAHPLITDYAGTLGKSGIQIGRASCRERV